MEKKLCEIRHLAAVILVICLEALRKFYTCHLKLLNITSQFLPQKSQKCFE